MSTAGVLIDVEARSTLQNGLRAEIAVLDSTIQATIPHELLPFKILKTERTLKELPDAERANWESIEFRCDCKRLRKSTGLCLSCNGTGVVVHYKKLLPFNWNSTDQVQDLARHYSFIIPKKRGEDREALEAKTLRKFGKRKPVFLDIWNARKRYKLISTYNWALDSENKVHTKFGFQPSNWRKSSKQPNLQNIPKHNDLAAAFKRTIIAAPGHVLIEADSSAIEAVIVGYCAQSPRYIKIAQAGIHGFVTSHRLALRDGGHGIDPNLPFAELAKQCKAMKRDFEEEYNNAKKGDHAVNYLLSAYGLNDEEPEVFPTVKKAQEFIDFYFSLFPDLPPWQHKTVEQADRQTFLDNHYQYRHYFYCCTQWDAKYKKFRLGSDAKRAVSFVPSSDASAIQTEDLLVFGDIPELRRMLRLIVHDSHIVECPINDVDYVCPILHDTMSRPRPELGGLEIGVEIKYGINLQDTQLWVPKPSGN
jgi:DNA polymerase-1